MKKEIDLYFDGNTNNEIKDFEFDKKYIIALINDLINNNIFPQIGTYLCAENDDNDVFVYHVKCVWFYNHKITFVLDKKEN